MKIRLCNHFNDLLKIFLLALSCFYVVSNLVHAETWIDIDTEEKYGFLQYDIDSLIQSGSNQIDLTWKSGTNLNMPYSMKYGTIDCQLRSTILNKEQYVETNALLKKAYGTNGHVTDFVVKKVIGGKYGPQDIHIDVMRKRTAFPVFASLEGQMIQRLCFTRDNDWEQRKKKSVAVFQSKLKCSPEKTGNIALLCRNDEKTTQDIFNTIFRMGQIESLCKVPIDVLDAIVNDYLIKISDSKRGDALPILGWFTWGLSTDLSRAVNNEKCSYIAMASEDAAKNAEERVSAEKFIACIAKTVDRLDDGISPADVIATAVYGVCRNELAGRYSQSEEFERGFKPGLIAIVLEHRAKKQNAEKK